MSSRLRWMPDWLTGPSLGQYMKVRPGDKVQHVGTTEAATRQGEKGLSSTKQMLKKHMVDSFFERALHQIEPELVTEVQGDEAASGDNPFEAISNVDPIDDGLVSEPIFEAELPLDDSFLVGEEEIAVEERAGGIQEAVYNETNNGHVAPGPAVEVEDIYTTEADERVGYYVFAITLGQIEFQLPDASMDEAYPLFVYSFGKAQAIISKVPLDVYSEDALQARLNDPSWFEHTLRKHTQILAEIQKQASIVPMRVCTICDNMQGLESFLKEHHNDFVSTLELIEGNHSWRFSIFCNEPRLRTLTAKASNRVRAIQAEMAGKSNSDALPLQEKLKTVLEEEARAVCKACVKHSHGTLSTMADKNMIQTFSEEQAGGTHKREIFRCDYMVPVSTKNAFEKELKSLIESYKSLGFELEIEGPQKPAQFAERKVLLAGERSTSEQEARPIAAL